MPRFGKQIPPSFLLGRLTRSAMPTELSQPQSRAFTLDGASVNKEKRTVEVCFSTDTPVARWGILEVLSHDAGAVDMTRLAAGANVLFNHDMSDYIGIVESARIDADRKGRAVLRFATGERAEQIFADVQNGILRQVSVGYQVHEWQRTSADDAKVDTWTAKRWEPYEISIVTVQADKNAGVGRSAPQAQTPTFSQPNQPTDHTMNRAQIIAALNERGIKFDPNATDEQLRALIPAAPAPTPPAPAEPARSLPPATPPAPAAPITTTDNNARTISILDMAKNYSRSLPNARDLADEAIRAGHTAEQFQARLLQEFNAKGARGMEESGALGMSPKEINKFSFARFLLAASARNGDKRSLDAAGFELEISQAAAAKMSAAGREVRGLVIPADVLQHAGRRNIVSVKDGTGYTGTGSNIIEDHFLVGSFMELLRNKCILLKHCTPLAGLQGSITIPKQTGSATAAWIGEDEDAPETAVTFGQSHLAHKTVAAYSQITREMLKQPSLDVEAFVRNELARASAFAIDTAGFYGSGGKEPTGLKNTNGIGAHVFTGNKLTYEGLVEMETQIASDNADIGSMCYLLNAGVRGRAKTTKRFTGTGTDTVLWEPGNTLNGYATDISQQIAGTDMFFGVFSEMIYAMWGGLELLADQDVRNARIKVSAFQDLNFMVRRPECFCYATIDA